MKRLMLAVLIVFAVSGPSFAETLTAQGGGGYVMHKDRWVMFRQRFDNGETLCFAITYFNNRQLPALQLAHFPDGYVGIALAVAREPKSGATAQIEIGGRKFEMVHTSDNDTRSYRPTSGEDNRDLLALVLAAERTNPQFRAYVDNGRRVNFSARGVNKVFGEVQRICG